MTFQPRMQNKISGFTVVNDLQRRLWNGIVADLWDVECEASAGGYYVARDPRIVILLDSKGAGNCNVKMAPQDQKALASQQSQSISYIPAEMELWAELVGLRFVRHLDLHFDLDIISRRLGDEFSSQPFGSPRLMFSDPKVFALAGLIAEECASPQPLHELYGDGLSLALILHLLKINQTAPRKRSQLASWQLRRATDFIEENCLRSIRLEELASLTGLSQSHFSHAFKASTGVAPHQWQMNARLDRAKQLLLGNGMPITTVAVETGFSDQAHFTRVFRKNTGTTPALWKKMRLA
ncbi:AraC family transcriptional regulator [Rhizobiaceae bacterium n13]|uniref:AraC family transcriptional regulator n=1 Tax=Ferirhizobium litorale TaxID=2927786 RepID=A0AAE3QCG8_9HYPH|nr:AraC family transcriptional regulator [Fererhizobium litorale]MDI7862157.1 AraC family transcriptional regulator [Fererhizobium litorale]MDI7922570.1 AraC family transcriptional regulator [Fererhizobium litorale]